MAPICLHTSISPNGHKISILLEELGLPYQVHHLDLPGFEHKQPEFLAINPNGKIPAITDVLEDGSPVSVFESGSIMQYLIERYDRQHTFSYGPGTKEHFQVNNWLFFQNAGVGPMQGQVNHFLRYSHATEPQDYALNRYINETRRLYKMVDQHLAKAKSTYLVGEKFTIADMALFPWANFLGFVDIDIGELPHVQSWVQRIKERPAVQKGLTVPVKTDFKSLMSDPVEFQKYLSKNGAWVRRGMEEDARR